MGYNIHMRDSDFRIKKSNADQALQALQKFARPLKNTFIVVAGVENARSLQVAMSSCRFDLELSTSKAATLPTKEDILKSVKAAQQMLEPETRLSGNKRMAIAHLKDAEEMLTAVPEDVILVTGISFDGERQDGTETAMFDSIAPFVEPGSYIEMQGEDGEVWRWVFDGVNCIEKNAEITF